MYLHPDAGVLLFSQEDGAKGDVFAVDAICALLDGEELLLLRWLNTVSIYLYEHPTPHSRSAEADIREFSGRACAHAALGVLARLVE